jgi:hypothetical protein
VPSESPRGGLYGVVQWSSLMPRAQRDGDEVVRGDEGVGTDPPGGDDRALRRVSAFVVYAVFFGGVAGSSGAGTGSSATAAGAVLRGAGRSDPSGGTLASSPQNTKLAPRRTTS